MEALLPMTFQYFTSPIEGAIAILAHRYSQPRSKQDSYQL
jgi:hypothetical protein